MSVQKGAQLYNRERRNQHAATQEPPVTPKTSLDRGRLLYRSLNGDTAARGVLARMQEATEGTT